MLSPKILEQIYKETKDSSDVPVVVEGKKDKKVLEAIGFSKFIEISGKSLEDVVEKILSFKTKQVIVLTDFDKEGENIFSQLHNILSHYKIKVNHTVRNKFKSLKIRQIEELNSITKLMEDDYNGEIGPVYNKIFNRSRVLSRRYSRKTRRNRSNIWSNGGIVGARPGPAGITKNW
jgi:5S rRNA maturation endonuclease (ribonuclease M5)